VHSVLAPEFSGGAASLGLPGRYWFSVAVGTVVQLAGQEVRHEATEAEVGRARAAAQQVNGHRDRHRDHHAAPDEQPTVLAPVGALLVARVKAPPVPALGERLHRIGLGPGRRFLRRPARRPLWLRLFLRGPFLLRLGRRLLRCLVLGRLLVRPGRLSRPALICLWRLRLPAVTAARITAAGVAPAAVLAAGIAAARLRRARRVTRYRGARVVVVPTRLTRLSLPAAVPQARLARADGSEVRELALVLRCGVIPLLLGRVTAMTRPAATRSAGE
jgi:hypothetical protein